MLKDSKKCDNLGSIKNKHAWNHPYNYPAFEGSTSKDGETNAQKKEWDATICPICMEYPHNVVLIYRKLQSNYRTHEAFTDNSRAGASGLRALKNIDEVSKTSGLENTRENPFDAWVSSSEASEDSLNRSALQSGRTSSRLIRQDTNGSALLMNTWHHRSGIDVFMNDDIELKFPLFRGMVNGWKVVEAARDYLNMKTRNCSHESCTFNETYEQLCKHARRMHPTTRSVDVDPSCQHAWRNLEHQHDFGDVLSTIRSAMPLEVVLGDYVLENEEGIHFDQGNES